MNNIPVLMYHHINKVGSFINVTPENFERQIGFLKKNSYQTLNVKDYIEIVEAQKDVPKKAVMITFDDGWLDNWVYAFPVLKRYGLKAVLFVVTSHIAEKGKRGRIDIGEALELPVHEECQKKIESGYGAEVMLSWEELKEMEGSGIIDIQSHTHTHRKLHSLYQDPRKIMEVLMYELKTSKQIIEERLGKECSAICWPWGIYNKEYIEAAKRCGYKLAFTTQKGINSPMTDPYRIKRIVIGNIGSFEFRYKLFFYSKRWLSTPYLKLKNLGGSID
ncbi:MAG: polysaccharide deacetylase family protein [Candidatus Omnitrophica bacterium]|nr:polysaccharide deacetylase family protein [Candidatus Omnitrophota bacterium]